MTVLVTGANGMIGSCLVKALAEAGYEVVGIDKSSAKIELKSVKYYSIDLFDKEALSNIKRENQIDRIIHLAALAHTKNEKDLSWERYYKINVECAKNVFDMAGEIPVLFISTVDVYGFFNGNAVNPQTPLNPITAYGKSKKIAEDECSKLPHYTIFRFSPVYTPEIKRDIQKRYYLKYPKVAYQIGKGTEYEILNINKAVSSMVNWCSQEPQNNIKIIKDDELMWTPNYIEAEKSEGRAKVVLIFPKWIVNSGYKVLRWIIGENKYTYLLNKAVYPLRSE